MTYPTEQNLGKFLAHTMTVYWLNYVKKQLLQSGV